MITSDHLEALKLLLAIVNSSVAFFYIKEKYPASSYNQGTTFTKEMLNDLPIPKIATAERAKFVSITDRIIAAKQRDAGADTTALEQDHRKQHGAGIDRLVHALYGLTPAEIKLIDESAQNR